jgi:hypothetical protein
MAAGDRIRGKVRGPYFAVSIERANINGVFNLTGRSYYLPYDEKRSQSRHAFGQSCSDLFADGTVSATFCPPE